MHDSFDDAARQASTPYEEARAAYGREQLEDGFKRMMGLIASSSSMGKLGILKDIGIIRAGLDPETDNIMPIPEALRPDPMEQTRWEKPKHYPETDGPTDSNAVMQLSPAAVMRERETADNAEIGSFKSRLWNEFTHEVQKVFYQGGGMRPSFANAMMHDVPLKLAEGSMISEACGRVFDNLSKIGWMARNGFTIEAAAGVQLKAAGNPALRDFQREL